jgi:muramoyltetrapeptide carboxypeptidase
MVATAIRQGADGYDRDLFRHLLFDGEAVAFDTSGCTIIRAGQATGPIVGGCLTLVTAAIGTSWEPDTRDAILLLEDNNTRPYQIDRMLTQLRQAGKLSGVRGIVFGEMPGCIQHENQGYTLTEVIDRVLGDFDGPVLSGFPTGHTTKPGAIVPLGVQSELSLADEVTFRLLEPAVVPGTYP